MDTRSCVALVMGGCLAMLSPWAVAKSPKLTDEQVIRLVSSLEQRPRDPAAPVVRSALIDWEGKRTDIVDLLCPAVLAPIPSDDLPNSGELLVQFVFGSAAAQLAHPEQKGQLQANQLAGMRSMLKAYQSLLALDTGARIPRLDELSAKEADGSLAAYLVPVVEAGCKEG